jgi:hypothetical protein
MNDEIIVTSAFSLFVPIECVEEQRRDWAAVQAAIAARHASNAWPTSSTQVNGRRSTIGSRPLSMYVHL